MRIVLCDHNRILAEALAAALNAHGHQVVAVTGVLDEATALVARHRPDACVVDPHVPSAPAARPRAGQRRPPVRSGVAAGLAAARAIRSAHPGTAVLLLSGGADTWAWPRAPTAGLAGFLRKDRDVSQIAQALDVVAAGGTVFDTDACPPAAAHRRPSPRARQLTALAPREREVLRRIIAGQSTERMAREMGVKIATVRTYVRNVLSKLGAHSRLQAAAMATRGDLDWWTPPPRRRPRQRRPPRRQAPPPPGAGAGEHLGIPPGGKEREAR